MGLLGVSAAVVPCLFTTRVNELFLLPKLVALWSVLAAALTALAAGVASGRPVRLAVARLGTIDIALAWFVALNVLAFALSSDRRQSLFGERSQYQGLATLVLYLGFFFLARCLFTDLRAVVLLLGAIAAGGAVVAGYAIAQRVGLDPLWRGDIPNGRVFSTIGQPNALAAYLVVGSAAAFAVGRATSGFVRLTLIMALAAMILAIMLTGSRGGYLGLVAALAVLATMVRWTCGGRRQTLIALAVLVGCLAAFTAIRPLRQTVDDSWRRALSSTDVRSDVSIRDRLDFWRVAGRVIGDHPLVGTGQETFPDQFPRYSQTALSAARAEELNRYRVESPHDVPLTIAATTGLPSLVAYGVFLGAAALHLARRARHSAERRVRILLAGALAGVVGHTVTGLFMTVELTGAWLSWVVLGAALGLASADGPAPAPSGYGRDQPASASPMAPVRPSAAARRPPFRGGGNGRT